MRDFCLDFIFKLRFAHKHSTCSRKSIPFFILICFEKSHDKNRTVSNVKKAVKKISNIFEDFLYFYFFVLYLYIDL